MVGNSRIIKVVPFHTNGEIKNLLKVENFCKQYQLEDLLPRICII